MNDRSSKILCMILKDKVFQKVKLTKNVLLNKTNQEYSDDSWHRKFMTHCHSFYASVPKSFFFIKVTIGFETQGSSCKMWESVWLKWGHTGHVTQKKRPKKPYDDSETIQEALKTLLLIFLHL